MSERQRKVIPDLEADFAQGREAVLEFVAAISPQPRLETAMKYTEARGADGRMYAWIGDEPPPGYRSLPGRARS